MKKTSIPIILLLVLSALNITTTGYVLQCPGTVHLNTYQDMNFSDCVNSSYFEFGPDYFWLSSMNFTRTSLTSSTESKSMIFYFDDYDAANAWNSNPENMVDGDYGTFATETLIDDKVQILTNNTVFGDGVGSIDTVEIRLFGIFAFSGKVDIQPVFTGGDGTYITGLNPAGDYTSWYDITTDTNAPATWGWDDVSNMDCNIRADSPTAPNICKVSIVEIRVTYSYSNYYRLSFFNDTLNNHTANDLPYRFFEFNGTFHDTGAYDFTMDLPESNYLIDFYADNVIMYNDVDETSGLYYFPYNFTSGTTTMFTFYIDGYLPECPTNGSSSYNATTNTVNFTWNASERADTYVIVRNNASYPDTVTDGYEVQNSTLTYYNDTLTGIGYFTVWAYNNSGRYSSDSCALDILWGVFGVSVFNESNSSQAVINWSIQLTNMETEEVYTSYYNTNILWIDQLLVPNGEDISVRIWADNYYEKDWVIDILNNQIINETFFLPAHFIPPGGDPGGGGGGEPNATFSPELYYIRVIDAFDQPVQNAKVDVRRYINDSFQSIGSFLSDANGYGNMYLIPNVEYKVNISKSGYNNESSLWRPDPLYYGIYNPKIFRIITVTGEDVILWTGINYSIEPKVFDHYTNFTMYFNISSDTGELEYYTMIVYFWNVTTEEWDEVFSNTVSDQPSGGSINYTTVDGVGKYACECSFKKDGYDLHNFGTPHSSYKHVFVIWPIGAIGDSGSNLDDAMTSIVGDSPVYVGPVFVAYSSLIACFIVMMVLFTFSPKYAGFAIIVLGIVLGAFKQPLNIISDDVMNFTVVAMIILLGVITIYVTRKKE